MHVPQQNLLIRGDTLFGVCAALGEDFGFNPQYLRVTLAVLLLVNPTMVIATYFAAGVVVLLSRLLSPNPRVKATSAAVAEQSAAGHPDAENEQLELAIAA